MIKHLKRLTAVLLASGLLIAFTGCGCQSEVAEGDSPSGNETNQGIGGTEGTKEALTDGSEAQSSAEETGGFETEETAPVEEAEKEPVIPDNVPVAEGLAYRDNGNGTCTVTGVGSWTGEHLRIGETIDGLTVTEIGANAFRENTGLVSVICPPTLVGIRATAFYKASNLVHIILNEGLEWISDSVFSETGIRTLEFPKSLQRLGDFSFVKCEELREITFPGAIKMIGQNTCYECKKLEKAVLSEGIEGIAGSAFYGCERLKRISFPDSVKWVDYYAFGNCTALQTVRLSRSLSRLDGDAFAGAEAIEEVFLPENETYEMRGFAIVKKGGSELAVGFTKGKIMDDGTIQFIGDKAFKGRKSLTSIEIPSSVLSIGSEAFYACEALKDISGMENVLKIGSEAFRSCYALTELHLSDSVREIGAMAFRGSGLLSATLGNGVQKIGDSAFRDCYTLTEADLGGSVERIGELAFYRCSELKSLTIGGDLESIGNNAFEGCKALADIYFNGTKEAWESVRKGSSWNLRLPALTVHCADGDIAVPANP